VRRYVAASFFLVDGGPGPEPFSEEVAVPVREPSRAVRKVVEARLVKEGMVREAAGAGRIEGGGAPLRRPLRCRC
jgi:hypothetical protein